MLYNANSLPVTLGKDELNVCRKGKLAEERQELGESLTAVERQHLRHRLAILRPLRELKEPSNPCGRGMNGMFSLEARAIFR